MFTEDIYLFLIADRDIDIDSESKLDAENS